MRKWIKFGLMLSLFVVLTACQNKGQPNSQQPIEMQETVVQGTITKMNEQAVDVTVTQAITGTHFSTGEQFTFDVSELVELPALEEGDEVLIRFAAISDTRDPIHSKALAVEKVESFE